MSLETSTDVEEIRKVQDGQGNDQPPANATEQKAVRDSLGNQAGITTFEHITAGTTAEQLPANAVPDGVEVLIVAKPGNAAKVYVGNSTTQLVGLPAGGEMTLQVTDTSAVYVQTPTSGDGVNVLYEA